MTPAKKTQPPPPDQAVRRRISEDLGTTFLVEAGAGSGKTKSLVDRMVALLAAGRTSIETLAAVTFTRKAAAELRGRFQVALEKRRLAEKDDAVKARLDAALTGLERSFIGTIHSFCARLLRERPVEAGVDPDFRELDDYEDQVLLKESWDEYQTAARIRDSPALANLEEAGLSPAELETAFEMMARFPEVEAVPGRDEPPDLDAIRKALAGLIDRGSKLVPRAKPEKGRDGLQNLFVRLFRRSRNIGFDDARELMETVELFDKTLGVTQNRWASREDAAALLAAAESFQENVARPAIREWREFRHTRALDFLRPAVGFYAGKRRSEARLNFQDQLMRAAALLRENPEVRRYFRKRFHPILVDEFQDTDPIQAEILFLLTGGPGTETDWTRLSPEPGSLFLVGDPKQSIYRFRRADVDIYNLVKERIEASGGETLGLTANFRSLGAIADWVNPLFDPSRHGAFPAAGNAYQAGYMPLQTVRPESRGSLTGVRTITIPALPRNAKDGIAEADSLRAAEFVAWALAGNMTLADENGGSRPARAGDFMFLFRYKDLMEKYARKLEERGIDYEIAGSDAFTKNPEINELLNLLRAVDDPEDPVATVAVLRGLFFGLSDQDLVEHRAAGGGFCFLGAPAGAETGTARVRRAFAVLRRWRELASQVPPAAAVETILQESGLINHLVTGEMGSSRTGNVLKLVEVLRSRESDEMTSFAAAAEFLGEWVENTEVEEMSLTPGRSNAVRLLNLHKAKGLEAPVVWLANPVGVRDFEPDKHVRRTGRTPRGHFRFSRPFGPTSKTVSQPAGWEESAAEEKRYEAAEEDRLMYVAATRAKDLLVISGYEKDLGARNAWGMLVKGLEGVEPLPECRPKAGGKSPCGPAPSPKRNAVRPAEVARAREDLRRKMAAASTASSLHETVTSLAKRAGAPPEWAKGGSGFQGTAVHVMLKTIGGSWPAGAASPEEAGATVGRLLRMARSVLVAGGLNPAHDAELAAYVGTIIRSPFWTRAIRSGTRLYEVPFSVRVGPEDPDYSGLLEAVGPVPVAGGKPVVAAPEAPVFLSGAVDLLFKEDDAWVIADYKTDRLPAGAGPGDEAGAAALASLVDYYRPQVELYTRLWQRMSGEAVKESGLYFTSLGTWVRIR